jgi:3-hydroxyisobutyrate dehydrogenase-like beta-hydroxyacid dehydrogenase
MIGQPEALIFYGGAEAVFEAHRPTLMTLGGRATYLGTDPGVPSVYDLALLGMLWSSRAGYLHALALVGTAKVGATDFLPYARAWFDNVIAPGIPNVARAMDEGDYATDVSSLAVNKAAIAHLISASEAQGIGAEVMLPIQALMDRRIAEGHGADSLASLIEVLKRPVSET